MEKDFLRTLKCPKCDGNLTEKKERLVCNCGSDYFIFQGVPVLLADFRKKDFDRTKKSFSSEWQMFKSGDKTWTWNLEERQKLLINELGMKSIQDLKDKFVLDAGCGNGQLTSLISNYSKIIGMDLSESVFSAEKRKREISKKLRNIMFIEGNIMNPPLKSESFDIIYSSGVLHHTPNTFDSFKSLVPLLKRHGRFYIYLYRKDRKDETLITYLVYRAREATKYLPLSVVNVICYMLAPFEKIYADVTTKLGIRKSEVRSIREHRLSIYDHLSPRYAYRHTIPEVTEWFKKFGFKARVTFEDRNGFGILGIR